MKKLLALVMLAGSIAFVSCNNSTSTESSESKTDSTVTTTPAPAMADTTHMATDSTKNQT
jgi:hypothetical protein